MASRELSKFEQDTLLEALTQIDAAGKAQKLAEHAAAIESERAGRVAAEAKVGELTAELYKRSEGYRSALAEYDTKLLQEREARNTAGILAAQARAEADGERNKASEVTALVQTLQEQIAALASIECVEVKETAPIPISYRLNVVGRDAAGDLRAVEIIPLERN